MLTKKQKEFFKLIIKCYQMEKEFPTIGILKKNCTYKSYNTIYKYLIQLEKKDFIKLDNKRKKIIYIKEYLESSPILNIPVINDNRYIEVSNKILKSNQEYLAFKLPNNRLNSYLFKCGDILIIEKNLNNLNNKFVLCLINDKYYILKYIKKDGFIHLLNDKEFFILTNTTTLIGKVVSLIRETMD